MDNIDLIDDIISTAKEPTADEMDTFKNLVADWFKYDDAIRKLKIAIRERKTLQQVLNNKIEDFMFKYNYNDLNTQNGRLKTNVKNVYKPINIKEVREIINNNKHLTGEELLAKIFNKDEREMIVKKTIRRIIPKVSMSLDI
jgi:hypothetical protein|uniref:Uncharacterized protein n=1 Tax=viral metagenome TaxID=1070528 RepID=A0A6C0EQ98_9ZZZZ